MILTEFINKYYAYSLEKLKKCKHQIEKREILIELINNLIKSKIKFTIRQLAKIVKCSRWLISNILLELVKGKQLKKEETRGRKKIEKKHPEIIGQIAKICSDNTFVDKSLKDDIKYLDITLSVIKEKLKSDYDYTEKNCPCENTIRRILTKKLGYKLTKIKKNKVFAKILETDKIFFNVSCKLKIAMNDPLTAPVSIDDKTAKGVGCLSDGGKSWVNKVANDHDTNPDYIVKPFGILDIKENKVNVYCNTSSSTADFKVDCIEHFLQQKLIEIPNLKRLMIFLDNGPENSSRRKLWKLRLIELSLRYNIDIDLVYYPPYHSKYNKIEHFWGVLQRHWNGLIIDTLDKLVGAINSCKWNGKNAKCYLSTETYEKGKKVDEEKLKKLEEKYIKHNVKGIEKWSLLITPH